MCESAEFIGNLTTILATKDMSPNSILDSLVAGKIGDVFWQLRLGTSFVFVLVAFALAWFFMSFISFRRSIIHPVVRFVALSAAPVITIFTALLAWGSFGTTNLCTGSSNVVLGFVGGLTVLGFVALYDLLAIASRRVLRISVSALLHAILAIGFLVAHAVGTEYCDCALSLLLCYVLHLILGASLLAICVPSHRVLLKKKTKKQSIPTTHDTTPQMYEPTHSHIAIFS